MLTLYIVLVLSVAALLATAAAIYVRVRRHEREPAPAREEGFPPASERRIGPRAAAGGSRR